MGGLFYFPTNQNAASNQPFDKRASVYTKPQSGAARKVRSAPRGIAGQSGSGKRRALPNTTPTLVVHLADVRSRYPVQSP